MRGAVLAALVWAGALVSARPALAAPHAALHGSDEDDCAPGPGARPAWLAPHAARFDRGSTPGGGGELGCPAFAADVCLFGPWPGQSASPVGWTASPSRLARPVARTPRGPPLG